MNIYLIRHGQTHSNRHQLNQRADEPLSKMGITQARKVAERLQQLDITCLVTSDYRRTHETATIIGKTLDLEPEVSEYFREIRRPDKLFNHSYYHSWTIWFVLSSMLHRRDPLWHYQNAENLYEIEARAQKARGVLREFSRDHTNVAVVSHAVFIEVLTTFMCREGSVFSYFPIFSPFSRLRNGSITHITYEPNARKGTCPWAIVSFGDRSHLTQ